MRLKDESQYVDLIECDLIHNYVSVEYIEDLEQLSDAAFKLCNLPDMKELAGWVAVYL